MGDLLQKEVNSFLDWAQQYANSLQKDACWICGYCYFLAFLDNHGGFLPYREMIG
jgi:hypothetical protein